MWTDSFNKTIDYNIVAHRPVFKGHKLSLKINYSLKKLNNQQNVTLIIGYCYHGWLGQKPRTTQKIYVLELISFRPI